MPYADWSNCCDVTRHTLICVARSTQTSQNIRASRKDSMEENATQHRVS